MRAPIASQSATRGRRQSQVRPDSDSEAQCFLEPVVTKNASTPSCWQETGVVWWSWHWAERRSHRQREGELSGGVRRLSLASCSKAFGARTPHPDWRGLRGGEGGRYHLWLNFVWPTPSFCFQGRREGRGVLGVRVEGPKGEGSQGGGLPRERGPKGLHNAYTSSRNAKMTSPSCNCP